MAKKDEIEISPKYGVNPTMPVCFFCGEDTGEIALMGRIRKRDANGKTIKDSDIEAPRRMMLNYEPCDKCKAILSQGITIIEVTDDNRFNTMSIAAGAYPTGEFSVIKEEAFERIFKNMIDDVMFDDVRKKKKLLLQTEIYQTLFHNSNETKENKEN